MSLGGLIGKFLGGEKEKTTSTPQTGRTIKPIKEKKISKAGKLALINTPRTGVFETGGGTTSGRGRLLGN